MTNTDYEKLFSCPKCGRTDSTIFFLKVTGNKILIKKKCPNHGDKVIKVPMVEKGYFLPLIRNGIFRCFKCGAAATVHTQKTSGPWTLVNMFCQKHKKSRQLKIWSSIFEESASLSLNVQQPIQHVQPVQPAPVQPVQPVQPAPVQPAPEQPVQTQTLTDIDQKYCPNCGMELDRVQKYCPACGSSID